MNDLGECDCLDPIAAMEWMEGKASRAPWAIDGSFSNNQLEGRSAALLAAMLQSDVSFCKMRADLLE